MNTQPMGVPGALTQQSIQAPPKVKYVLYARKSTESEERQVLSIDSQIQEMLRAAEKDGMEIVDIRRESHSAKDSGQRPVFNEILKDIRESRFNGILTWAPDRLSKQMFERVANEQWSGRKIYHWLRFDLNYRTIYNHHLSLSNIYRLLQNPFYYGVFEYPKGSGSWYTGKPYTTNNKRVI